MASTKQQGMVFHQEGSTTPAAAPAGDHPPACFAVLKPGKASEGGMEQSTRLTNEEVDKMGKPNMYPSKEAIRTSAECPAMKHPTSSNPQSDNLSPDSMCKGIRVTLDSNSMWNEFFRCKTEMILTKQGSRMFPYCRFRISGLQPSRKYSLIMDIQPLDNSRYKWTGKSWQVAGKADCHVKSQPFAHPESPSTGQHWMQNPVSFYKLKLTNNNTDQDGNTVLHPMHRYLPRLHVVQTDKLTAKDIKLNGPGVVTFTFPQTEFMAVTAYQNSRFAQLKVDYNPFTKGLKEDGSSSWGLKLKLNTGKVSHKDGDTTANEQHPFKKSLKSLLANHKPRSSKAVDSKPSVSGGLQQNSTAAIDQSAAKVNEEQSCTNSGPSQKLFSELIREAHVSLQRCNLEQLGMNNSTSHKNEQTNTKATASKSNGQDVSKSENISVKTQSVMSPAKKGETVTKRKAKEDKELLNSLDLQDIKRTDEVNNKVAAPAVSQCKAEVQSEVKEKQHKRPAPLPLPALALFLKQHSSKSKKAKSKLDIPLPALPSESLVESQSSTAVPSCPPFDHASSATGSSKDPTGDIAKCDNHASGQCNANFQPEETVFNFTGQEVETAHQPSISLCPDALDTTNPKEPGTDDFLASISIAESKGPEPVVPGGTSELLNSDQPFCTLEPSIPTISSTIATSSLAPILSPPLDTVLPAPNSPQTPTITESSTLPPDSPSLKSDCLLPDPECSFYFEPSSPASSPEPLPSLPTSLTLQLDSTDSGPTPKAVSPGELPRSEDSGTSVFKWHTVLPPPEPYIDTSFSTFQPTPQTLPLVSISSPLFPVQTPSHPEQQTFATPPPDPAPSFQENEQSLPFPAELSPLALQLPLSPTFSALDGDGLSPTPSLTDLVHFFSTDDDLGMGVDFSNTEAVPVPCPPPSKIEANTREPSCQVQPFPANKPYKRKKKSRRRKPAMTDLDQKMDEATYTKMQPNLEEVEEQLFISFTSKEALKLHVVDSSEEVVLQPQSTSDGHLQQINDASENDKSMEVGGSSLPDSIHPNNFPAKLWRLVNNTANKAICWDSQGEVITIDQNLFERHVLSQSTITSDDADAFKTTNFTSFVRQLNLYGFRKADPVNKDDHHPSKDRGAYHRFYNPNFRRNHPELVANLKRLTVNNKAKLQAGLNVNCRPRFQRSSEVDDCRDENMKQAESASSLEEKIAAFEKILLRDLKLMRHRQVIHPVLQEVGLKMNLLDPTLAIDLQYLGVRLPIPPPGVPLEPLTQELPPSQAVCAAFVSRTGKTTDVTQIKGWREKFTPSEAPPTAAPPKPEAGPSSDLPKKNLSAFCSDMLDEYLENEGKLIDERAASFSQPVVEPVVYELPTRSTSYVRTLDNVLKKQTSSSPTSDLISGFVPPSKRPKLSLKEARTSRREKMKQRSPKHRPRPEPATGLSSAHSNLDPKQAEVQSPNSLSPQPPVFTKRKKLKPKTLSQTLTPFRSPAPPEDMAPLESDSELVTAVGPSDEAVKKNGRPTMTRTLLKQKDLEDGVVWEGRPRTSITEERAAIALTSLFTQTGFVSENPTAPIQLVRRRAPPCLNDFCRLGCVCSSLSRCSRISHCGRPSCMFGCSCLKQKVVLLKNLDGSDSSPSHQGNDKKRKRKRRMKMAYILKEAESVSQPAERVQILWKRGDGNSDPDPIHVPKPASRSRPSERREEHSSCARVRGYRGRKKTQKQKQKESSKDVKTKNPRLKRVKHRDLTLKETMNKPCSSPPAGEPAQPAPSDQPPSPPAESAPKPSKRLIILAECKWASDSDRSHVLKNLCERMAWDQLDEPFWIKNYLISPIGQTVEESGTDRCIQYKIHISTPKLGPDKPAKPAQGKQRAANQQQDHLEQVVREAEPPEDWQQEIKEEWAEPLEYWQQEVEEEGAEPPEDWQQEVEEEGAEPPEDWQREVEEDDIEEEPGPTLHQVHDGRASSREEMIMRSKKTMDGMALPLLTGISPAGFLSANKKQPGGTDHVVQVNAKLYPLAKIQLGKMGALHPANRLAAYLTGRVGSNRRQPGSSSSPIPPPTPLAVSQASPMVSGLAAAPPPRSQPAVTVLPPPNPAAGQPAPGTVGQSAASSGQRAGEAPEGAGSKVVTVRVFPGPPGGASQVSVAPGASRSPTPASDSVVPAQKGSQLLFVQVPGPGGKLLGPAPRLPPPASTAQRMVLQPVQVGSGAQYYRRPDGKLVQLVPISQLRSANQNLAVQRGSSSPSLPPAASRQTPLVPVVSQPPPVTPSPLAPSRFLAPKGSCTFRLLPPSSSRDPIVVTCAKAPPRPLAKVVAPGSFTLFQPGPPATPMNLISLKASAGRGAELGVKTVSVSAAPVGPGGLLAHQEPTTPQTAPANQPPTGTNNRQAAPPPPEVTAVPLPPPPADNPELACDPVDLDIICVDDDTELVTMETEVGGAKPSLDKEAAASSDTENSSDFCDETDSDGETKPMKTAQRHNHNQLEKQRRAKMLQLFESLRREVGLSEERTSKINTLNKAVQVIQQLRMTETDLQVMKRRLIKRRDGFLNCIIPTAEESGQVSSPEPLTGSEGPGVTEETEEVTDNSSDEERVIATVTADVTKAEGGVQSVAMETEKKQQQKDRGSITKDSEGVLSVKKLLNARRIRDAFRALSSAVSAADAPKTAVLKQAYQEIQNLKREEERLRSLKICLKQQRDAYVRDVSLRSGKSELRILRKLQHLSSKQSQMERQLQTANQLPAAAGGGASDSPGGDMTDDDIIIISSNQQQQTPQAPPTPVSAPPTSSPVQQPHGHLQRVPQVSNPNPPPPAASHNASVLWNRPRTVPNILSRRRNPVLPSPLPNTVEESASFQALVPAEVLSLVGAVLPGQQVLTLSPLMAGPTVLQTSPTPGVASVTLNFPNLTNQQIHLASLPRPPPGKIYSSSAPLTINNLTAANFNNLLQLVQPSTTQQQQTQQQQQQQQTQQQQQQQQQTQQHPEHQQVPAGEPPPPQVVSAGSDQIKDQDTPPDSSSSSSPGPGLSAGPRAEVTGGGPVGQEQQEDPDKESLTSLLDELVFLNQQTGRQEEDHAHSPWLLQLDSDSDEAVATETTEAGLNDHTETTQSGPQPGPANGGVLAPPPLLQMKVGGAKVADPTSGDGAAGGEGGGGAGGREGGVAWRPMPRLVPLGLRGNPPS